MVLPRQITGGAPIDFGGRRWWLRITYRVLLRAEESTGVDMLTASVDLGRPSSRLIRALLWAALVECGAHLTEREVGAKLNLRNLFAVHQAVIEAWIHSMPEREPEKKRKGQQPKPPSKAMSWIEAWAEATSPHGLGLSNDAWLDLTPRQLHALRKVRLETMQHEEYLAGIVASTTANYGFCRPKKALSPESFMPHPIDPAEQGPVTGEQIMAMMAPVKAYFAQRKVS